jgi:hypothetical protein
VHTVELYRGLPDTKIRHITPRHEQWRRFHGRRLCTRQRPAGRLLHHLRPRYDEYHPPRWDRPMPIRYRCL